MAPSSAHPVGPPPARLAPTPMRVPTSSVPLRAVRPDLWSALPPGDEGARYDARAAAYDRLVGHALYNRLAWSASTDGYRAFARQALASTRGAFLDAGCGSAVFTADAYADAARAGRPLVLVDRSLDMLDAARDRIARASGGAVPASVQFVQADLLDLPFRPGTFGGALSMGTLHLFPSVEAVARAVGVAVEPGGGVFLSGLVAETPVGRRYLALLARVGEVAAPRRFEAVRDAVAAGLGGRVEARRDGSMAYLAGRSGAPASG